jgi:hypothetical protein
MKNLLILIFMILTAGLFSTIFFEDHFIYNPGDNLGDQVAWTNTNTGDEIVISSGTLVHPWHDFYDHKVSFGGAGMDPYATYLTQTSGKLYACFVFRVTDVSSFTSDGYFCGLASSNTNFGPTLWLIRVTGEDKFQIGLHRRSGSSPDQIFPTQYELNQTIHIVMSYEFLAGDDIASLWINPPGMETPPDLTSIAGTEMTSLSRFFLRQDSTGETPIIDFDEVRVYSIWEDCLPVELSAFTANYSNGASTLQWTTQSENNNLGWNVYRSETDEVASGEQVNYQMIEGAGTTTEPTDYGFTDENEILPYTTYWYWIESVEQSGSTNLHGPAIVTTEDPSIIELPETTLLKSAYPNPFNPSTVIEFDIKENETGTLTIFNTKGQIIVSETFDTGYHQYKWNADDLSSGVYFYKLRTESFSKVHKMLMLK